MSNIVGVDVGTGNGVCAKSLENNEIEISSMRNMFTLLSPEDVSYTQISDSKLDYVEQKNSNGDIEFVAVIGEDAYRLGLIYNKDPRRPMKNGVISSQDIDAIEVVSLMMHKLTGGNVDDGILTFSVPAQPVDENIPSVSYHERVFSKIFKALGYKNIKPLNEAMAIVYSECSSSAFSAISFSFGAGLTNVCYSYKGTPAITFSVNRGGDWIDKNAGESVNIIPARITALKEKDLDLLNPLGKNKRETVIKEAISFYYRNLIEYVLKVFVKQFEENTDGLSMDEEIPIVVSGGTSLAENFLELFKEVFEEYRDKFPYQVSEIRQAKDPLNAVAMGCLAYSMFEKNKLKN